MLLIYCVASYKVLDVNVVDQKKKKRERNAEERKVMVIHNMRIYIKSYRFFLIFYVDCMYFDDRVKAQTKKKRHSNKYFISKNFKSDKHKWIWRSIHIQILQNYCCANDCIAFSKMADWLTQSLHKCKWYCAVCVFSLHFCFFST